VKILLIGDSISMGYAPAVMRELSDVAEVVRIPDNGGTSANVLAHLDEWLGDTQPEAVSLNCGLHDIVRERGGSACQVPLGPYEDNLRAILSKLAPAGPRAAWVTTTPVIEERQEAIETFTQIDYNADVDAYNARARAIVDEAGVPIVDLHASAVGLGLEEALSEDGLHFTDAAYGALGKFLADSLRELLA